MTAPARNRNRRGGGAARQAARQRAQSTPTVEQAPGTTPPATAPRRNGRTGRTSAAERAYARRAQRAGTLQREPGAEPARQKTRGKLRWPTSRASFVLMVMGLLVAGVVVTLWLSTQAIADSYRLEQLRGFNAKQVEHAEQLQREVTKEESASALAQKAKDLGMVPGGDPARILVNPDGSTTVVGEPKKAHAAAPPPMPVPTPPADGTQPTGGPPVEGDQPAVPADPAGGQ
jgi:hypothetical protein